MMSHYIEVEFARIMDELAADGKFDSPPKTIEGSTALVNDKLCERCLANQKFDDLIDYFTDQYAGGGGDQYYAKLSQRLLELGDKQRFTRLWRIVIGIYKRCAFNDAFFWGTVRQAGGGSRDVDKTKCYGYIEALAGMDTLMQGLKSFGDFEQYEKIKEDLELFKQGKQRRLPTPDRRKMDEHLFWDLIEQAKDKSSSPLGRSSQLTNLLEGFSASAIKIFASMFEEKLVESFTWELWAIAYITLGGCSDDGYKDFRAWLISEGKDVYRSTKANPEALIDLTDRPMQLQGMLNAADDAYYSRTNKPLVLKKRQLKAEPAGIPWTDEELPSRYPRTCRKFDFTIDKR